MRVRVQDLFHKSAVGIWLMRQNGDSTEIAKPTPLEWAAAKDGWILPDPTLEIPEPGAYSFFQNLVNALIEQGYRPNNDKVAGMLEAQTRHLEDMRTLVFRGKSEL